MSISTPQGGGSRRPSATKATVGGKPNLDKDESTPAARPAGTKATGASEATGASKAAGGRAAGASKAAGGRAAGASKAAGGRAAGASKAAGESAAGASKAAGESAAGASKAAPAKAAGAAKAAGTRAGAAKAAGASRAASAAKAAGASKAAAAAKAAEDADTKTAAGTKSSTGAAKTAGSKATGAKAGARDAKPAGTKAGAGAKAAGSKPAAKTASTRPAAKAAGRRPIAPVRVSQGRNWGPIFLFAAVILVAVGIIGFAGWKVWDSGRTVSDRVNAIDGVKNFRKSDPNLVQAAQHQSGPIKYGQNPPVAGKHNPDWQNCMGDVYSAAIANEHAVHSMEHGAVWVVYNPAKLDKDQIAALAKKVEGKDYTLMSPMDNLDTAVSVQAWGFQLKTDNPADNRIDQFIKVTRKNAGVEAASCSGGITETGTTPRDLQPTGQPAQPGG